MTANTLKITYGQADAHSDAARQRLERAEAGERGEAIEQDAQFILNFEDLESVEQLMRQSNMELLEAIVDEQPQSIRSTADVVERDYKEVHRNLKELESLGVVEFEIDGTKKKPILRNGAETIDFSLQFPQGRSEDDPSVPA